MDIAQKRAVVTGAASGIGRAIAVELARRGAAVLAADVDEAGLAETLAQLGERGASRRCDVADHADVERLAANAQEAFGGCDLLFANAGILIPGPVWTLTPDQVDRQIAVNFRGVWSTAACFVPMMQAQDGGGSICFTGSEHSLGFQHAGAGIYTATKHAVLGLADVLRAEAGPAIRVSVFCPGMVQSQIGKNRDQSGGSASRQDDEFARRVQARAMPADEAARQAVDGVLRGEFLIVTHAHAVRAAERRFEEIGEAFAAQAPWFEGAEKLEVMQVIADVSAELKAQRGA